MYTNVIIGTPLVHPSKLFASSMEDWETNERPQTLFTSTRFLPTAMKEAGLVSSTSEVRRNRKELCVELQTPNFFLLKWGKRFLTVAVGPGIPEAEWASPEFEGDPWPPSPKPQRSAMELLRQALRDDQQQFLCSYVSNGHVFDRVMDCPSAKKLLTEWKQAPPPDISEMKLTIPGVLMASYLPNEQIWGVKRLT